MLLPLHMPTATSVNRLALCCADDDNDLGLAHLVAKAYLPGITADSVAQAVAQTPQQFHVAVSKGVFATEEILRLLIAGRVGHQR